MNFGGTINADLLETLKTVSTFVPQALELIEDAGELTRLVEQTWSLKPASSLEEGPLVMCQFIDECCMKKDRSQAISAFVSAVSDDSRADVSMKHVIENCVDLTNLETSIGTCPLVRHALSPVQSEPNILKQEECVRILTDLRDKFSVLNNYKMDVCNAEQWHALICLSNSTLVAGCMNKFLKLIRNDYGQEVYESFFNEFKQHFVTLSQQLTYTKMQSSLKLIEPFVTLLSKYNDPPKPNLIHLRCNT